MASQFSGTNGTDIKTSAAPAGSSKTLPPLSTKSQTLTPQTQLTGAAILNRQRSTSPKTMSTEHKNTPTTTTTTPAVNELPKQSPNPAALLTAGFGMGAPADAPKEEPTPSRELGSLPGVAAAAAAMEERESPTATTMSGTDSAGLTTAAPPQVTTPLLLQEQYPPLQPQPPPQTQMQQPRDQKDTGTPGTSQYGQNPTTPVTPFSPSGSSAGARGKHTCSHCLKTFTRHHNLKSHLLTHAHEKPYLCTTCQARFRRLHDLKRHSKLHTGERPHVCNKCGRRFARGDALARHARGEGGCAGRRGSMSGLNEDGSMGVGGEREDDIGDLEGLMDDPDGDVMMDDVGSPAGTGGNAAAGGGRRRQSLPSLRTDLPNTPMTPASAYTTAATPLNPNSSTSTASSSATLTGRHPHHLHHHPHHHPHHNTYPPPSARSLAAVSETTNPQSATSTTSSSTPGQTALSASAPSPPLFSSGISFNRTPAPVTTPTPSSATAAPITTTTATATGNTVLSPAGVLTDSPGAVSPGMTRERTPSFTSSGGFLSPPGPVMASSGAAGGRTGGTGTAGGGVGSSNVFASGMDGVWAYIRTLEDRIRVLEERAGSRE